MSPTKFRLCNWILKLDRIPRYGRLYATSSPDPRDLDGPDTRVGPAKWTWQRNGHWGVNLLKRLGWLWQYVAEYERREHAASD